MEKVKITEEKKASLICVSSHWPSFPGLVPTSPQEDCKLWICVCGYSIEALPQGSHVPSLGCGCCAGCWECEVLVALSEDGPEAGRQDSRNPENCCRGRGRA